MDHHNKVREMTMHYARKVIGDRCKDLDIIFDPRLFKYHGKCYPGLLKIKYSDKFISVNIDNEDVLKWVVIEECAHLRHFEHDTKFYDLCIQLGYDVRIKPYPRIECWKTMHKCDACGNRKYYYLNQPKGKCTHCGNNKISIVNNELYEVDK